MSSLWRAVGLSLSDRVKRSAIRMGGWLLHIERSQLLRWFGLLTRMPTGHLLSQVVWACPTRRRTCCRDYISRLAWKHLGVPPFSVQLMGYQFWNVHLWLIPVRPFWIEVPFFHKTHSFQSPMYHRIQVHTQKCKARLWWYRHVIQGEDSVAKTAMHLMAGSDQRRHTTSEQNCWNILLDILYSLEMYLSVWWTAGGWIAVVTLKRQLKKYKKLEELKI